MGNNCCGKRKQRGKIVLLLLGLDNAGKTVAVKKLARESVDTAVPTVGFSVINLKHSKYDVKVFDLGGRTDFRDVWERYYVDAHGIVFVVDSSDYDRLTEAQMVLYNIMANKKIQGKPLLLLANKQDNENALDEIDLIERLDLESLANTYECPTLVKSCCANSQEKLDPGIKSGYNWILKYIIRDYPILNKRVVEDIAKQEELDRLERAEKIARLKLLNEQDAIIDDSQPIPNLVDEISEMANGSAVENLFVRKSPLSEKSTSSESLESIPQIYCDPMPSLKLIRKENRPQSATNLVRKHLEMDSLKRRHSLKIFNNKTKPLQLYGVRTPKSAGINIGNNKGPDRRLRSAGDSVFVISNSSKITFPENNGAGDLNAFVKQSSCDLTPINDVPNVRYSKLRNGIQL